MSDPSAGFEITLDDTVIFPNTEPKPVATIAMNVEPQHFEVEYEAPCAPSQLCDHENFTKPNKSRVRCHNIVELAYCLLFLVSGLIFVVLIDELMLPLQRPIPSQYLGNINEYAKNLVYNEQNDGQTLPIGVLLVLPLLGPLFLQLTLIQTRLWKQNNEAADLRLDTHRTACCYIVAVTINIIVAYATAYYMGYLSPIFYSVCQPDAHFQSCSIQDTNDVRSSFPSAITSLFFCTFSLLTFYLQQRLGLSSIQRYQTVKHATESRVVVTYLCQERMGLHRLKSLLALAPMGVALFVGVTLIVDNLHFPIDVVGGATLGTAVACYCHHMWFPDPRYG